jgi:hypothetical protein
MSFLSLLVSLSHTMSVHLSLILSCLSVVRPSVRFFYFPYLNSRILAILFSEQRSRSGLFWSSQKTGREGGRELRELPRSGGKIMVLWHWL